MNKTLEICSGDANTTDLISSLCMTEKYNPGSLLALNCMLGLFLM